jgi:2-amino-4-hydroxy-6-hydroxymethyldihydropteridine diphosphokinase
MKENKVATIGIGTNIGDKEKNITEAIQRIKELGIITKKSNIYESEPVGYKEQDYFLNMVLAIETKLSPTELIKELQKIEKEMGRVKEFTNGPRIIDLDILLYDNLIINTKQLTIPHPSLHTRNFVLTPLEEISKHTVHPKLKETIKTLKKDLKNPEQITLWTKKK